MIRLMMRIRLFSCLVLFITLASSLKNGDLWKKYLRSLAVMWTENKWDNIRVNSGQLGHFFLLISMEKYIPIDLNSHYFVLKVPGKSRCELYIDDQGEGGRGGQLFQ